MKTLYHYTDAASADAIMKSCKIKASTFENNNYDVAYGEGVYFTDMDPSGSDEAIAKNNWTKWKNAIKNGKLDCAIEVVFSDEGENKVTRNGQNRIRYLYGPNSLDLKSGNVISFKKIQRKT